MPQRAKSRVAAAALIADYLPLGQLSRAFWFVSLALVGTAILTLSAKIKVDLVYVNVTMQTFAVFAIAALYGSRLAVATVALYLLEGALGMPVFTGTPEKALALPIWSARRAVIFFPIWQPHGSLAAPPTRAWRATRSHLAV